MAAKKPDLFTSAGMNQERKRYGRTMCGGANTKGHRKHERPLAIKKSIHLVLKSSKAVGRYSFLTAQHQILVKEILYAKAAKFGVAIGDFANVGNHLHLKIRISSRIGFQRFLKSVTTLIARKITGAARGRPFGKFWQGLAFTRVLKSSLEELNLKGYFEGNRVEAGKGPKAREAYLKQFNDWVYRQRRQSSTA